MLIQELTKIRKQSNTSDFHFQAEIFNKAIWGDMGEDSAQISITCPNQGWHLSFIRTQSGDPSPFDDFVCNVVDEYEKELNDEQLYDMLTLHRLQQDFDTYCASITTK